MIKIFAAFAVLTVMISTTAVYSLKQATYDLEEKKRNLSAQILKDREAIKVLKAEMAYLSRPERLERLSRRHLVIEATENTQLVSDLETLSVRDGVQMASVPIDNFQLLLPRQKPDLQVIVRKRIEPTNDNSVRLASLSNVNDENVKNNRQEPKTSEKSLYERILAKIGR